MTQGIYRGKPPAEVPLYTMTEAAHHLRLPVMTLRSWALGRAYPTQKGVKGFDPIFRLADPGRRLLSFLNLVEAQVLRALRTRHGLSLRHIRMALHELHRREPARAHPLALEPFLTNDADLFLERYGRLINLNRDGQYEIAEALKAHLKRIERASDGSPIVFYPFLLRDTPVPESPIALNPRVAFGRPVLAGTGISTAMIASLIRAGDSIESVSGDYELSLDQVRAACAFEAAA